MNVRLAKLFRSGQRFAWSMLGGQRFTAFGRPINLTPDTERPASRRYQIPPAKTREQVIRYTDHVQLRSIADFLNSLQNPPVVVEVGAYTGAYATILGSIIQPKNGRMIAVEPDPKNCAILRENIARNRLQNTVTIEQLAIGNSDGTAKLTGGGTQATIGRQSETGLTVQTATLRTLLARHQISRLDLLILDVEGAELLALQGFPWETVKADRIFCEFHPYAWEGFGYKAADVDQFLAQRQLLPIDMFFRPWPKLPVSNHWSSYIGPTLLVPVTVARTGS